MKARAIDLPLGELEVEVMDYLWHVGESDVRQAHQALSSGDKRSLNTIQSTLDRLHRKGILDRVKQGRAFHYTPAIAREELLTSCLQNIADQLGGFDRGALMAAFLTLDGVTSADLDRLQALIDARRENEPETDQ